MELGSSIIETGVDKLVNLIKQRGRIAMSDAAKELGVSIIIIQEWVDFLEEEGIISVEYKLTKPFLVERKLTRQEVDTKEREFKSKKDVFVRKAEVSLSFIEDQAEELKKVKGEFDKLKSELGIELDSVKNDLKSLESLQQSRNDLKREVEEQKDLTQTTIMELTQQIMREQKKYQELISDIKIEKSELLREKTEAKSIEASEHVLNKKLGEMKNMISILEKKISNEDSSIKNSQLNIDKMSQLIDQIKQKVDEEKSAIEPLVQKSREQERKIIDLQDKITKKIALKQKDVTGIKDVTKRVNDFFEKKLTVLNLIDKINKDRDELEKTLTELIKKANHFN